MWNWGVQWWANYLTIYIHFTSKSTVVHMLTPEDKPVFITTSILWTHNLNSLSRDIVCPRGMGRKQNTIRASYSRERNSINYSSSTFKTHTHHQRSCVKWISSLKAVYYICNSCIWKIKLKNNALSCSRIVSLLCNWFLIYITLLFNN